MSRKSWDKYWIDIAEKVATRSTCDRANVGSVIVRKDNTVISTGYNGSPPGKEHCDDVGHLMISGHCCRTRHSEVNAILMAEKYGHDLKGCTIYCTHSPCDNCLGQIIASGIKKIRYKKAYRAKKERKSLHEKYNLDIKEIS